MINIKPYNSTINYKPSLALQGFGSLAPLNVTFNFDPIDHEKKGFAKRFSHFEDSTQQAASFRSLSESQGFNFYRSEIHEVISRGLGHLKSELRDLLHFFVTFLNMKNISKGNTFIWPSTKLICDFLGISAPTLRRRKVALEKHGLILRWYDCRNRPMDKQAIDLAPFLSHINEYHQKAEDIFEDQRDYWKDLHNNQFDGYDDPYKRSNMTTKLYKSDHLKQTLTDISVSVPKEDRNTDVAVNSKSPAFRGHDTIKDRFALLGQEDPAPESPDALDVPKVLTKASRLNLDSPSQLSTSHLFETPPQSVFDALRLSPVLLDGRRVEEAKAMSAEDLLDWLALRVSEIYPTHNTGSHTWPWAIKKFGWKAVELLVVALEDPQIKDGSKFIGGMTHKWDYPLQLSPNLKRIKAMRKLENVPESKILSLIVSRLTQHSMSDYRII